MAIKSTLFVGSWQKVLIKVILLLLVLYVVYRLIKGAFPTKSEQEFQEVVADLTGQGGSDGSTIGDADTISDNEADNIANSLESYMSNWGTDYSSLSNSLQCLNGASLNKVYISFGQRFYSCAVPVGCTSQNRDLFGWFAGELSNSLFVTGVYYNDCVENCTGYWDLCHDLTYMRNIWMKSSIPVTF